MYSIEFWRAFKAHSRTDDVIYNMECKCTDSKVYGANMGPAWDRRNPGGPHVGPINLAILVNPLQIASLHSLIQHNYLLGNVRFLPWNVS